MSSRKVHVGQHLHKNRLLSSRSAQPAQIRRDQLGFGHAKICFRIQGHLRAQGDVASSYISGRQQCVLPHEEDHPGSVHPLQVRRHHALTLTLTLTLLLLLSWLAVKLGAENQKTDDWPSKVSSS